MTSQGHDAVHGLKARSHRRELPILSPAQFSRGNVNRSLLHRHIVILPLFLTMTYCMIYVTGAQSCLLCGATEIIIIGRIAVLRTQIRLLLQTE